MESFLKKYCNQEWQEFIDFHKSKITIAANSAIFKEGDVTEGLYIVNSGKVKVVSKDSDEKEMLIRLAADGDILGHRGFGGDWNYPISAIAYVESQLTFIPIKAFNVLVKSNAEFTYHLMMFFAEELRASEEKIMQIPVKNRIARAIWMNYKVFGFIPNSNKLSYTINRKDIASKANTTYESVIRTLSELNKIEIIKLLGKEIEILDLKELEQLANYK